MSSCVQGLKLLKQPKNQISFHRHFNNIAKKTTLQNECVRKSTAVLLIPTFQNDQSDLS